MRVLYILLFLVGSLSSAFSQTDTVEDDIAFAVIEKVPVYPGCNGSDNEVLKKCMSRKIQEHVSTNFNTSVASNIGLSGINRIYCQFKIDKQGDLVDIKVRAPHKLLSIETKRVLSIIPQMEAGEQKGKKVGVLYSLPIVFHIEPSPTPEIIETPKQKRKRLRKEKRDKKNN